MHMYVYRKYGQNEQQNHAGMKIRVKICCGLTKTLLTNDDSYMSFLLSNASAGTNTH